MSCFFGLYNLCNLRNLWISRCLDLLHSADWTIAGTSEAYALKELGVEERP
jgi:hypothetical protein